MVLWLTTVPGQTGPGPPGADVCSPGSRPGLGPQREHHSGRRPVGDKLGGEPCPQGSGVVFGFSMSLWPELLLSAPIW